MSASVPSSVSPPPSVRAAWRSRSRANTSATARRNRFERPCAARPVVSDGRTGKARAAGRSTPPSRRLRTRSVDVDAHGLAARRAPVGAALDERTLDPDASGGGLEPDGDPGSHAPDRELRLHADHRVVRPGHAGVGDRRRSPRLHARVRGLDVRVRPDHRRHTAVEPARKRDLLARRLGVHVDDDDGRRTACLVDELVDQLEHAHWRGEEELAEDVHDRDRRAVQRRRDREPAAGRVARQVRRPDDALARLEVGPDLLAPPDVVAERDHVGARGEEPLREPRRDPDPVGDVLAVQDAEFDAELVPEARQALLDRPPAGRTDDVGDEEDPQGEASEAAWWTSIETWFPASRVKRASASFSTLERSMTVPIFAVAATTEEPTVSAGSGRRWVSETSIDGAFVGWMSIRTPNFCPFTM